mmetsp:Transcript_100645/g.217295  ORF Transcript_100645/g.217295 Transcript_100645/m.217295 type:complete len:647 (+) Transcript_100645:223-2163(+)
MVDAVDAHRAAGDGGGDAADQGPERVLRETQAGAGERDVQKHLRAEGRAAHGRALTQDVRQVQGLRGAVAPVGQGHDDAREVLPAELLDALKGLARGRRGERRGVRLDVAVAVRGQPADGPEQVGDGLRRELPQLLRRRPGGGRDERAGRVAASGRRAEGASGGQGPGHVGDALRGEVVELLLGHRRELREQLVRLIRALLVGIPDAPRHGAGPAPKPGDRPAQHRELLRLELRQPRPRHVGRGHADALGDLRTAELLVARDVQLGGGPEDVGDALRGEVVQVAPAAAEILEAKPGELRRLAAAQLQPGHGPERVREALHRQRLHAGGALGDDRLREGVDVRALARAVGQGQSTAVARQPPERVRELVGRELPQRRGPGRQGALREGPDHVPRRSAARLELGEAPGEARDVTRPTQLGQALLHRLEHRGEGGLGRGGQPVSPRAASLGGHVQRCRGQADVLPLAARGSAAEHLLRARGCPELRDQVCARRGQLLRLAALVGPLVVRLLGRPDSGGRPDGARELLASRLAEERRQGREGRLLLRGGAQQGRQLLHRDAPPRDRGQHRRQRRLALRRRPARAALRDEDRDRLRHRRRGDAPGRAARAVLGRCGSQAPRRQAGAVRGRRLVGGAGLVAPGEERAAVRRE